MRVTPVSLPAQGSFSFFGAGGINFGWWFRYDICIATPKKEVKDGKKSNSWAQS
jgi:hypothetical protein